MNAVILAALFLTPAYFKVAANIAPLSKTAQANSSIYSIHPLTEHGPLVRRHSNLDLCTCQCDDKQKEFTAMLNQKLGLSKHMNVDKFTSVIIRWLTSQTGSPEYVEY